MVWDTVEFVRLDRHVVRSGNHAASYRLRQEEAPVVGEIVGT